MGLEEKLYEHRKKHNFTQEDLAEKLSVTRQTISNWENGSGVPSIEKAKELASVYGISLDELAGSSEPEKQASSLLKKWENKDVTIVDQNGISTDVRIIEVDNVWMTLRHTGKKETKTEMIRIDSLFAIKEVCK